MEAVWLGAVEARFADLVWEHAPLTTVQLVAVCEDYFGWRRTTTYTVLKKCCRRGLFSMEDSMVTCLLTRDQFYLLQAQAVLEKGFGGSLPAFLAAYAKETTLTEETRAALRKITEE